MHSEETFYSLGLCHVRLEFSCVSLLLCLSMLLFRLNAYLLERTQRTRETKAAFKSTHLTHATHLCGCHGEAFKKFCFFNYRRDKHQDIEWTRENFGENNSTAREITCDVTFEPYYERKLFWKTTQAAEFNFLKPHKQAMTGQTSTNYKAAHSHN